MAFEELKENLEETQVEAKAYLETSVKYYKLWGFKVAMQSTTLILKFFLIVICGVLMLLFLSFAAAFALGQLFESTSLGFLCVAGFYLLLAILLYFVKPQIIEGSILSKFSEIFFNE